MLDIYEPPLCNLVIYHHLKAISMKGMNLNRVKTSITTLDLSIDEFIKNNSKKHTRQKKLNIDEKN